MKYIPPFGSTDPDAPYVDRNTATATRGSAVPAGFFNDVQAELLALIEAAGLTPDAAQLHQIVDAIRSGGLNFVPTAGGTADALTVTFVPAPADLTDGMTVRLRVSAGNTGAATLNVNGLGAKPIVDIDGNALAGGELLAGQIREFDYDAVLGAFIVLTAARPASIAEVEAGVRKDLFVSPYTKWTSRLPYFSARQIGTMSLPSSVVTKVAHITSLYESYFADGASSYASASFTCGAKDAGVWLLGSYLAVPVTSAAAIRNYIGVNGSTIAFQSIYTGASGTFGIVQSRTLRLSAGDNIDVRGFQNSGVAVDVGSAEFFGIRIAN